MSLKRSPVASPSASEMATQAFLQPSTPTCIGDSLQALPPLPRLVNPILLGNCVVELAILFPGAGDVAEIAVPRRRLTQARTSYEGFDGYDVKALPLGLRPPAKL
jgi:hypothetical protein